MYFVTSLRFVLEYLKQHTFKHFGHIHRHNKLNAPLTIKQDLIITTARFHHVVINPLTPNDPYRGRTAPLTSKVAFYVFIQQI
jgi:hypothetical protein